MTHHKTLTKKHGIPGMFNKAKKTFKKYLPKRFKHDELDSEEKIFGRGRKRRRRRSGTKKSRRTKRCKSRRKKSCSRRRRR